MNLSSKDYTIELLKARMSTEDFNELIAGLEQIPEPLRSDFLSAMGQFIIESAISKSEELKQAEERAEAARERVEAASERARRADEGLKRAKAESHKQILKAFVKWQLIRSESRGLRHSLWNLRVKAPARGLGFRRTTGRAYRSPTRAKHSTAASSPGGGGSPGDPDQSEPEPPKRAAVEPCLNTTQEINPQIQLNSIHCYGAIVGQGQDASMHRRRSCGGTHVLFSKIGRAVRAFHKEPFLYQGSTARIRGSV